MTSRRKTQPAKVNCAEESNVGPLKGYIGFQLRRAQDVSFQAFARRVGEHDLGPGRFAILSIIHESPGINQTALSVATGRDKSTLTPALRDLVKRGFVRRERSRSDRRAYVLNLTEYGEGHLRTLAKHAEAHDKVLDGIVGSHNKALFIRLLEQVVAGLSVGQRGARK